MLARLNHRHAAANPGDSRLESRIAAYELAARMQRSAPEALDLASETPATRDYTGWTSPPPPTSAAAACWPGGCSSGGCGLCRSGAARAGRRTTGTTTPTSPRAAARSAAERRPADRRRCLRDLKARGLLEDTLVVLSTEFGRQPFTQGATGRDHNGGTSVAWLAGAGVKAGVPTAKATPGAGGRRPGETYCYDLHATILHLLGIDHTRLTFRHNGIDRRLTDVHGHVIKEVLA